MLTTILALSFYAATIILVGGLAYRIRLYVCDDTCSDQEFDDARTAEPA